MEHRSRTLAVGGGRIAASLIGVGPPEIVFLHEALGSVGLWRGFPEEVCKATAASGLVYDRFGHGWSSPMVGSRTHDYLHTEALDVLPQVLSACAAERPVLVGHSDGASIALVHAGSGNPVSALVLIAPHVFVEEASRVGVAATVDRYQSADLAARLGRHHRDPDRLFRAWSDTWLDPDFAAWNIENLLPAISAPVLLVQGDDDRYGTLEQLDRVERGVAGPVTRLIVEAGGHAPHLRHPDLVVPAIRTFLGA